MKVLASRTSRADAARAYLLAADGEDDLNEQDGGPIAPVMLALVLSLVLSAVAVRGLEKGPQQSPVTFSNTDGNSSR